MKVNHHFDRCLSHIFSFLNPSSSGKDMHLQFPDMLDLLDHWAHLPAPIPPNFARVENKNRRKKQVNFLQLPLPLQVSH